MNRSSKIVVDGAPYYMHGANYPWMLKNGKSNYGLDFGVNKWGSHHGVTTNLDRVGQDFATMQMLGFNTLRWFVFTDGRGGIQFDETGMPLVLADRFFDDMDAALAAAGACGIKIIFVLLDYLWMHDRPEPDSPNKQNHSHMLKSDAGQDELIGRIFHPIFHRYSSHPGVLAWEVMNEPDWVVAGLDVSRAKVSAPVHLSMFKTFVRKVSNAVHFLTLSKVTVGGGRIKYTDVWDDDYLQLDFLQVHTYNDFLNQPWDTTLFGKKFNEMNLKRPLLIGEFSTNAPAAFRENRNAIAIPLSDYLDFSLTNGFAGCLYWSYNNVDKCGSESITTLKDWSAKTLTA